MTTRRDVLIGIAGVAAAAAVPVEVITKAADIPPLKSPTFTGGIIYDAKIGDIVTIEYDGTLWRVVSESKSLSRLEPLRAGDLEEGTEYTLHLI